MSHLNLWILAFSNNSWFIKTDLSGNIVWPQTLVFQKLANLTNFGIFKGVSSIHLDIHLTYGSYPRLT